MKRVFADTHFYIALLNRKDPAHERAKAWIGDAELEIIVTTGWVLAETANATAKSHRRGECGVFLLELYGNERTEIVPLSDELQRRGFDLYVERSDKEWSLRHSRFRSRGIEARRRTRNRFARSALECGASPRRFPKRGSESARMAGRSCAPYRWPSPRRSISLYGTGLIRKMATS